jgi:hypothetical protein
MSSLSQNIVGTTARILEDSTGPPRPSCKYPPGFQGACMHAAQTPDCRKPKLTHSPAFYSSHARTTPAPRTVQSMVHTFASLPTITDYQPSTSLSALHNISSSVLSDIIHSAFPVHCRAVLLVPTPGVTPHHRCYLLQHKFAFPPAPAFGLPKRKMVVATPGVLG